MGYTSPVIFSMSSFTLASSVLMFSKGRKASSFITSTSVHTVVIDVVPDSGPTVTLGVAEVTEGVDVGAPVVETKIHNTN